MAELTKRYIVMSMATEAPFDLTDPDGAFVLKPWKDPTALRALMVYRENCYPELGQDLDAWIRAIQSGPALRGDVGRRNEPHLKPEIATPETPRGDQRGLTRTTPSRSKAARSTKKKTPRAKQAKRRRWRRAGRGRIAGEGRRGDGRRRATGGGAPMIEVLLESRMTHRAVAPLSEAKPLTLDEGYALQDALREALEKRGEHVIGWKAGLTSRSAQDTLPSRRCCVRAPATW